MTIVALIVMLVGGAMLATWVLLRPPAIKEKIKEGRWKVDDDHRLIERGEPEEKIQAFSDDRPPADKK